MPALGASGVAVLFARRLTAPLFRLIARDGTTKAYTATALFIVRVIASKGADAIEEFAAPGMVPVGIAVSEGPKRLGDLVFASLGRERERPVPG